MSAVSAARPKRKRKKVSYVVPASDDEAIEEVSSSSSSESDSDSGQGKGKSKGGNNAKRAKKKRRKKDSSRKEKLTGLQSKSPAEFFAENQNIAGFDNPGKALYTTIREFVENSLDAAEGIGRLPVISVDVVEIGREGLNDIRGVEHRIRKDERLYAKDKIKVGAEKQTLSKTDDFLDLTNHPSVSASQDCVIPASQDSVVPPSQPGASPEKSTRRRSNVRSEVSVFRVTCKDNGGGMPHHQVPNMLGRVLSGSNYGLRQTRGKFGLGSKMALIWSKKSTGMPIEVKTAYCEEPEGYAPSVTYCKLDIDILRNEPKVLVHKSTPNDRSINDGDEGIDGLSQDDDNFTPWRGTEISVIIEGNWLTYQKYIRKYFEELAVVTPYAELSMSYTDERGLNRSLSLKYARRSDRIPPMAAEVKHHPKSVNNLIVRQLMQRPEVQKMTVSRFLNSEFQCISKPLSKRLALELGFDPKQRCKGLNDAHVHSITQLLRDAKIPRPSGDCLSPAGEYNLKLGIMKEFGLDSRYVATASSTKTGTFEGHPFQVECGISFGGEKCKEGITVHRFANRIPLLFEQGSDVASVVAKRKINWSRYSLKNRVDKIGVFVSIVSTKIPFKGTGKEFISAQNQPYENAIRTCLLKCANKLKAQISRDRQTGADDQRRKNIAKYIPNVCRYITGVLQMMAGVDGDDGTASRGGRHNRLAQAATGSSSSSGAAASIPPRVFSLLQQVKSGKINNLVLEDKLTEYVSRMDDIEALERITSTKRNQNIAGPIFIPAIDYHSSDTFAQWQVRAGDKVIFRPLAKVAGEEFWRNLNGQSN